MKLLRVMYIPQTKADATTHTVTLCNILSFSNKGKSIICQTRARSKHGTIN